MFKNYKDVTPTERTRVWNAGFSDYITPINMSEEQLDNRLKSLSMSETDSKVYYYENKPAGIYLYGERTFATEKMSWLGGMSVDPTFRGQQIALKMLEEFEDTSKANGVTLMTLEAIDGNDRAIEIYKKFGFDPIAQVSFLNSEKSYSGESRLTLKKDSDLSAHGVEEPLSVPWQNKAFHGYDCFSISSDKEVIGYVVANKQGENLIINQLEVTHPESNILDILKALNTYYMPKKWIGSNLLTDSIITKELINNGFQTTVTQHQYIKNI